MNPVSTALEEGYSEDQVLNFISNAYPSLSRKISKALNTGYAPKNVLNFLSNFFEEKKPTPSRATSQQAVHAEKRKQDIEQNQKLINESLKAAATLGGGYIAGRALQNVVPKVGNLFSGRGIPRAASQASAESTMAPLEQMEKILSGPAIKRLQADLDALKLTPKIEKLASSNVPETIGALLQKQIPAEKIEELESKYGKSFSGIVKEYADRYLQKAEKVPLSRESLTQQFNVGQAESEEKPQEKKEPLVALPNGRVGKLLEERQGIGSVELPNGQIARRKLSEVDIEPPELEKQITDLIHSIPEEERSGVLAFASYTPDAEFEIGGKKQAGPFMGVQFHNGDFYMYPDVTREQFDKVVQKTVKAKTTGENPWHAWTAGKESRGAGMHELIQELRKEFGDNFIKFKASEGYDYFKRIREIVKKIERERKTKKRT